MDFGNFILSFVLQMVATLGLIFLFGKIIALCNGAFYRNFGSRGRAVCYATGFIGTPVHEASHALMCLIFGHRITDIKFFQLNSSDGTLGYVHHAYNPRNLYQKVGCFFIGIAPVLVGALILAGLLYLLLPELFAGVSAEIAAVDFAGDAGASLGHIWRSFVLMFSYIGTWQWWVFLLVGSLIALHMTLSREDVKGALSGMVAYLFIFLVVDVVLALVNEGLLSAFTGGVMACGAFLLFFFCIFLVIALLLLVISLIYRAISSKK